MWAPRPAPFTTFSSAHFTHPLPPGPGHQLLWGSCLPGSSSARINPPRAGRILGQRPLPPACSRMADAWPLGGSEGSHPSPLTAGPSTGVGKPTWWGGGGWEVASPVPRLTGPQLSRGCRGPKCSTVMCVTGDLWAVGRVGRGQVKSPIWKPCYCPEAALRLLLPRDHKLAGELARLRGGLRIPEWPVAPPPPYRPAPPPPRASPAGNHLSSPSPRWSYRIAWE